MSKTLALTLLVTALVSACGRPNVSELQADQPTLPEPLEKMYEFVRDTQIQGSSNERADGTWPSRALTAGPLGLSRSESNLFMALQMSMALHRVAERYQLPGLDVIDANLSAMLHAYVADIDETDEPSGSVAHWALYRTSDDKPIRYAAVPTRSYSMLKLFDIANDLDTSSQAYLWAGARQVEEGFRNDYIPMLANWRDLGTRHQHRLENRWKTPNSGAFLTWNERDKSVNANSRIPGGYNDVDCVVNLNVLTSLYAAERQGQLPEEAMAGRNAACNLLLKAVEDDHLDRCAVYYDETHTYMAYARALMMGATCLEPARPALLAKTIALANTVVSTRDSDPVNVSEMALALKWLSPLSAERAIVETTIRDLHAQFGHLMRRKANGQLFVGEGELYHGTIYPTNNLPWTGRWLSDAASTAYALEALSTP